MKVKTIAVLSGILSLGAVGAASAADMAVKARPMPAPIAVYSWTGFYIGGNVGGAWADTDFFTTNRPDPAGGIFGLQANIDLVNALGTGSSSGNGVFTGGFQAGYNWQVSPNFLLGVEGDFNWLDQTTSIAKAGVSTLGTIAVANAVHTNWFATARARAGVTFDRTLLYVTGGAAFTDMSYAQAFAGPGLAVAGNAFGVGGVSDDGRVGWTVGGGIEQAFWGNWSVKAEYLFARFDGLATNYVVTSTGGFNQFVTGRTGNLDLNIGRVGLNYRFGGPVVAKY